MNREIRYRGINPYTGQWEEWIPELDKQGDDFWSTCDNFCQFTGLLDKEGNRIFENDVLRSVHFKEGNKTHYLYHIVKWDNRLSGWIAQNVSTPNGNFTDQGNPQIWVYMKNADFDILGPIHDHPHLLNKQTLDQ